MGFAGVLCMYPWMDVYGCIRYLVGGILPPLKEMTSSVGMMTFPTEWKNTVHVPNHQPGIYWI